MSKLHVLKPRVSEKAYSQSQTNVYVISVEKTLDKVSIARAIEAQFAVTVEKVNTLISKGKSKRTVRKGGRPVSGRTSDFKKAYVSLKKGDSISIFATDEQTKPDKAAKKEKK